MVARSFPAEIANVLDPVMFACCKIITYMLKLWYYVLINAFHCYYANFYVKIYIHS
jgi:hypothetical protein